jgi:hypothetical protein
MGGNFIYGCLLFKAAIWILVASIRNMSWLPYTADMPTGYFKDDIYMTYTEYYGDGTVYGLRHVHFPDGTPGYGLGPGLTRADLVAKGMVVPEERADAVPIDISVVPEEGICAAATPAPAAPEVPAVAAEAPAAPTLPTVCSEACMCVTDSEKSLKKVTVKVNGVTVSLNTVTTKEVIVNVDESAGTVEFVL